MKTMKTFVSTAICGLVLLVSAGGIFAQEPPPPPLPADVGKSFFFTRIEERSSNKVVKGAPYSAQATTETSQTLADGNQIHRQTATNVYRDSQGRTRREQTLGEMGPWSASQSTPRQVIFINDPVAGVTYVLHPEEHVANKMPPLQGESVPMKVQKGITTGGELPPTAPGDGGPDVMYMTGPPPGEPSDMALSGGTGAVTISRRVVREGEKGEPGTTESLGTQTMEGVQATGTRTTNTIPAGRIGNDQPIQIVTERWYSPALQTVVMSKRSDPRVGVTTYRLTNISLTEPSPDLFQVPADYTVKDGPALFEFGGATKPSGNQ